MQPSHCLAKNILCAARSSTSTTWGALRAGMRTGLLTCLLSAPLVHATQFYNKGADPGLPFSLAVRAGDYIFISGQLGIGPTGLAKGLEAQSKQAMDNIAAILKGHNLSMDDIVKCTVMLTDMSKWNDFNRIYTGYFRPERLPARSAMGVSALAMGGEVEIECIAYLPRRL